MSLEMWEAVRFESALKSGRTKPLVLECQRSRADGISESRMFVVKSLGHPNVFESTLFNEAFGNSLARLFGVVTPEPALIALRPAFKTTVRKIGGLDFQLQGDWGVGCLHISQLIPISPDFYLTPSLVPQASMIYALDLLTNNPDRRFDNPNCAFKGGKLVAFDFESMFGRIPSDSRPWHASKIGVAQSHLFKNRLAEESVDWLSCGRELRKISEAGLYSMVKDYPFQAPADFDRICDHILTVQEHESKWLLELEQSIRTLNVN